MPDALVIGSARGVWDDVHAAASRLARPTIFAVNLMVAILPEVDHAVSHHGAALVHAAAYRHLRVGLTPESKAVTTHSTRPADGIDRVWPAEFKVGDSGLLAARIALALGFDRVVLAGIPIDASGHVYDDPDASHFNFLPTYRDDWERARPELKGRVVSMSGWTKDLLGAPA